MRQSHALAGRAASMSMVSSILLPNMSSSESAKSCNKLLFWTLLKSWTNANPLSLDSTDISLPREESLSDMFSIAPFFFFWPGFGCSYSVYSNCCTYLSSWFDSNQLSEKLFFIKLLLVRFSNLFWIWHYGSTLNFLYFDGDCIWTDLTSRASSVKLPALLNFFKGALQFAGRASVSMTR